jgi:DNA-binding MarR family transcriptional regulator
MSKERNEIDRVWRAIVVMVMDTRDEWRRNVDEATGLPFTRVRALRRLAAEPLTLRELAESLGMDAPAATVAVNDLAERGFVTRKEHPDDRRAKLVSLTPAGRALVRAVESVPDHAPESMSDLSAAEMKTLKKIFDRPSPGWRESLRGK